MSLERTVMRALKWPTFLSSLFVLYWSVPIASLSYHIRFLDIWSEKRGDVFGWSVGMKRAFGTKVYKVGTRSLYRKDCIYLINHRSWGDFLIDQYLTEGRSTFLSRGAVAAAFPFFMSVIYFMRAVMVFKRGKIADKEKFNRWIDRKFKETPQTAIAVYPEGHRSTLTESLPLKRGMLHYAYSRKLPVQIIIATNKEAILSEKHSTARWGQTVLAGYSDAIFADKFDSFDDYMAEVQRAWNAQWNEVYSARREGLPELIAEDPKLDSTLTMRLSVSLSIIIIDIIFLALMYWCLRLAVRVVGLLGPLQLPLVTAFAVYFAASFYVYSRPFDAAAKMVSHRRKTAEAGSCARDDGVLPPSPLVARTRADVSGLALNREDESEPEESRKDQ